MLTMVNAVNEDDGGNDTCSGSSKCCDDEDHGEHDCECL